MKKHVSQMITYERMLIWATIRRRSKWEVTPYCQSKLDRRKMSMSAVLGAIKDGVLVEFHRKHDSNRVLIRGVKPTKGKDVACVVVDISEGSIVTAYWNTHDDSHPTLDWSAYDGSLNVVNYIKGVK